MADRRLRWKAVRSPFIPSPAPPWTPDFGDGPAERPTVATKNGDDELIEFDLREQENQWTIQEKQMRGHVGAMEIDLLGVPAQGCDPRSMDVSSGIICGR